MELGSTSPHPMLVLEQISLAYDTSRPNTSMFTHTFWNISDDTSAERVPIQLSGFDALKERSEAQSARLSLLSIKYTELLNRICAIFPILTTTEARMQALKKRLHLANLMIFNCFKRLEIIRKHSTPIRSWERALRAKVQPSSTELSNFSKAKSVELPSEGELLDQLYELLSSLHMALEAVVRSISQIRSKVISHHE